MNSYIVPHEPENPPEPGHAPEFDFQAYLENCDKYSREMLLRPRKNKIAIDILDTEKVIKNKEIAYKEKNREMDYGYIWQEVIGTYDGYINLGEKHTTGLDIISVSKKVAIELKSRTNTDNSSSKKSNLNKLAKFKMENKDYTCIYANINGKSKTKNINHNGEEIVHMVGRDFLEYIFGNDTDYIIEFIKNTNDKYYI
jgi:hypothetical protein